MRRTVSDLKETVEEVGKEVAERSKEADTEYLKAEAGRSVHKQGQVALDARLTEERSLKRRFDELQNKEAVCNARIREAEVRYMFSFALCVERDKEQKMAVMNWENHDNCDFKVRE